jgi:cytochrome c
MQARISALVLLAAFAAHAAAAGDATRGAQLFRQCAACHSTAPGDHMTGPSLAHVWSRKAAAAGDFARYSDALKRSGLSWDEATLDRWLASPETLVPGNAMTFPGVRDAQARQDLIAYLKAIDEKKASPPAAKKGGGMMGMTRDRLDLKQAPLAGQVRSIKHCRDTYTVETADGKVEKIWEFNLRFKSDSSRLGPAVGRPVVVGAGMQGDRASVVFASPREISAFIQESCP